jgi:two-component system, sensor histidine kinase LadS
MAGRLLFSLFLIMAFVNAVGQSLIFKDQKSYELRGHVQHLRDSSGWLSFDQVLTSQNFAADPSLNHGFDESPYWFSVDFKNQSRYQRFLLEIAFAPLDRIDFYYPSDSGWVHKTSGDEFPISIREFPYQHAVFKFDVKREDEVRLFIRVQSTSSVQLPAIIWEPEAFSNRAIHFQIFNGMFYGAMLIMCLYQIFLFLSTRDRVSLYYVFTLIAMMHVVSYFQGHSFLYAYPEMPQLNKYLAIFTGPIFLIFSTWLTRAFLNLKKTAPLIDKLLILNVSVNVIATFLMVTGIGNISFRFHHYAIMIHSLLALVAAGFGFYNRFRPALFYLLSWVTLLVAAVIFSMSNLGFFRGFFNPTPLALIVACLLQMLFVSFALGNRWNILVKENQLAKESEIERKEVEKERLEEEVKLRTEEIQEQNEKLEEVNRIKDKLFSIISHDIKGPLTSLQLALTLTKNETISQQEFREFTHSLETRFNQTTEFIENLLQWAKLQLKGESFEPVTLDMGLIAKNTLQLLDPEIRSKAISVRNLVIEETKVFADPNMLRSVMRNLVMNAIKFTRHDGTVEIKASASDGYVTVSVSDTGIGIPAVNRDRMFSLDIVTTLGTKQEKGTGLGLILCKEFVERNGGKIWFESEEGKGTTFFFTVPAPADRREANVN